MLDSLQKSISEAGATTGEGMASSADTTAWPYSLYERRHPDDLPRGRVVFYGDSDIEFWDTERDFEGKGYLKCGVSGGHMKHARAYAPRLFEKYAPSVVVLVAGENDLGNTRPLTARQHRAPVLS